MTPVILNRFILRALRNADGAMQEEAIINAALQVYEKLTASDVMERLRALDRARLITGLNDEVIGQTWSLTTEGTHKAKQLP